MRPVSDRMREVHDALFDDRKWQALLRRLGRDEVRLRLIELDQLAAAGARELRRAEAADLVSRAVQLAENHAVLDKIAVRKTGAVRRRGRPPAVVPAELTAVVLEDAQAGHSAAEISELWGVSVAAVSRLIKERRPGRRSVPAEVAAKVVFAARQGQRTSRIAAEFGISVYLVKKVLADFEERLQFRSPFRAGLRISDEEIADMVVAYEVGTPLLDIVDRSRYGPSTVWRLLLDAGVQRR